MTVDALFQPLQLGDPVPPKRIRVNTVAPGQMHTPMVEARPVGQRARRDVEALLKSRLMRLLHHSFEEYRLDDLVVKSDGSIWITDPHFGIAGYYQGEGAAGTAAVRAPHQRRHGRDDGGGRVGRQLVVRLGNGRPGAGRGARVQPGRRADRPYRPAGTPRWRRAARAAARNKRL